MTPVAAATLKRNLRIGSPPWPGSIVAVAARRSGFARRRATVVGAWHAIAADAAHRGHALLIVRVIARGGAAPVRIDGAPRIVVGGLGAAFARIAENCPAQRGEREQCHSHGASPGCPLMIVENPRPQRLFNSP